VFGAGALGSVGVSVAFALLPCSFLFTVLASLTSSFVASVEAKA
jgi:hypothetical protein